MKHFQQTLATYVYNHCNMCNIRKLPLQHPYETCETSKTLQTCVLQHRKGQGRSIPGVGVGAGGNTSATSTSTNSGAQAPPSSAPLAPALAQPGRQHARWVGAGCTCDGREGGRVGRQQRAQSGAGGHGARCGRATQVYARSARRK
jgi:hypothetical protein